MKQKTKKDVEDKTENEALMIDKNHINPSHHRSIGGVDTKLQNRGM